jgi:hypothetical protein
VLLLRRWEWFEREDMLEGRRKLLLLPIHRKRTDYDRGYLFINDSMFPEQDYLSRSRDEEAFHDVREQKSLLSLVN